MDSLAGFVKLESWLVFYCFGLNLTITSFSLLFLSLNCMANFHEFHDFQPDAYFLQETDILFQSESNWFSVLLYSQARGNANELCHHRYYWCDIQCKMACSILQSFKKESHKEFKSFSLKATHEARSTVRMTKVIMTFLDEDKRIWWKL